MSLNDESRSIDFAKTASIDLMALNNKVVNMRPVVKRTKVQIINKLCKNIAALKKKKGTDEQKTQNLKKAERFIEEIDCIKHLKVDKVSKYSLANTTTFTNVCKVSQTAGPRALARLADHALMQKVVGDFRSQHPDWKDLAAYLLIKQTGRRFKTKKQKEKNKKKDTVANINASETMTKVYIQDRFGKEGLAKAELRFERKRKRTPLNKKQNEEEEDNEPEEKMKMEVNDKVLPPRVDSHGSDGEGKESSEEDEGEKDERLDDVPSDNEPEEKTKKKVNDKVLPPRIDSQGSDGEGKESSEEDEGEKDDDVPSDNEEKSNTEMPSIKDSLNNNIPWTNKHISASDAEISLQDADVSGASSNESTSECSEQHISKDPESDKTMEKKEPKKRKECVVKEFNLEEDEDENSDSSDVESISEPEAQSSGEDEVSDSDSSADNLEGLSKRQKKKALKTPALLKNKPAKPVSDPFFAGSDDDDVDTGFNDFDEALRHGPDLDDDSGGFGGRNTQSMFYNPHGDGHRGSRGGFSRNHRGGDNWRGQGRGGDSWRGRGRGRGMGGEGAWRGSSRGRGDRGRPQQRGFSRGRTDVRSSYSQDSGQSRFKAEKQSFSRPPSDSTKPASGPAEKLHPSWEASKKRRAEQSGIQAFKGSKITFDDD